jgi:hypothetical protein
MLLILVDASGLRNSKGTTAAREFAGALGKPHVAIDLDVDDALSRALAWLGQNVLPTPLRHDLENTGTETLRAVAFFAAAMFTQDFDQVMLPPKSHILGTPNRDG